MTHRSVRSVPALGYGDYLRFSQLVQARYGLHFSPRRRVDLEQGVRRAFAASTCADLSEYYRLLQDPHDGAVEMDRLVNALTVSETHFFRNAGQFDALYHHVLPEIIVRRRSLRTLRIWSAGCASGEEPYSIAMLLRELLPDVDQWSITILGTDVNTASLDRARQAVYSDWAFREERAKEWRPRYFDGPSRGRAAAQSSSKGRRYALTPQVRRMVTFAHLNLVENRYPSYETNTTLMDLVLCRNVTIYFTAAVATAIVDRFYDALVDGGWLVVGHAEHSLTNYRRFQAHNFADAILYQRTGQSTAPLPDWEWLPRPPVDEAVPPVPATCDQLFAPERIGRRQDAGPPPPPPEPEGGDPLERARELLELGHSERARELLLPLLKSGADHAPVCTLLGRAYANLGLWEEAADWCRRALGADTLALETYYTLALVLQHQGRLEQAIDAMKKVIYIDRHNVLGHFGLADLYRSNGQLCQAFKSLDNTRRLLEGQAADALIPDSGGITVARLRETVIRQQQRWSVEGERHT